MIKWMFIKIAVLFVFAVLCSCSAPVKGPAFIAEPEPKDSESLLYIYRPYTTDLSIRKSLFHINGMSVVELQAGGYTAVRLSPGEYELSHSFGPILQGDSSADLGLQIKLKGGTAYFVAMKVSNYPAGTISLRSIDPVVALQEIASCKWQTSSIQKSKL